MVGEGDESRTCSKEVEKRKDKYSILDKARVLRGEHPVALGAKKESGRGRGIWARETKGPVSLLEEGIR